MLLLGRDESWWNEEKSFPQPHPDQKVFGCVWEKGKRRLCLSLSFLTPLDCDLLLFLLMVRRRATECRSVPSHLILG